MSRTKSKENKFIGPTVYETINVGGPSQWKAIWENILKVYEERCIKTSNKSRFYWDLSTCLGKILFREKIQFIDLAKKMSIGSDNVSHTDFVILTDIENSLDYNFNLLLKTFITLSFVTLTASWDAYGIDNLDRNVIDTALANINVVFKNKFDEIYMIEKNDAYSNNKDNIVEKLSVNLQKQLNDDIEKLFETLYKSSFDDTTNNPDTYMELLPNNLVQWWVNLGPIMWLWFHLTAGKLTYLSDPSFESTFKEFFNNFDIFISCGKCREHFVSMRDSEKFQNSKRYLPTDLFLIEIHKIVRQKHDRIYERDERFIDSSVFDDSNYVQYLREEYKTWWMN